MKPTSTAQVLTWGFIGLVLSGGFHFTWESLGRVLPGVPWPAVLGMLLLAGALVVIGWPVKKWNEGDRTKDIDHVQAARIAMLAKAAALAGSLLTGWYLGWVLYLLLSVPGLRVALALGGLVAVAAAAALMAAGLVVEQWCKLPPEGGPGKGTGAKGTGDSPRRGGPDPEPA